MLSKTYALTRSISVAAVLLVGILMRAFSLIAVVVFLSAPAAPARAGMAGMAGMVVDCVQTGDWNLKISGCTAMIGSGQYSGEGLAWAYYNRGAAYHTLGEYRRAIEDYDQALRINQRDTSAYYNRGNAYATLGELRRAIEDYSQALRLDPGKTQAYNNRGIAYRNLGEYRRAIEDYDQALRLDPDYAAAYNNRGNAYANLGNPARAIKDYDQALRLNPGFIKARANRGIVYNGLAWDLYLKGRSAQALDNADRSLSDRPDSAAAINTRAHVLAALGRRNEALGAFERVMRVGGADWVRTYQEALAKHGYYPSAIYGGGLRAADPGGAGCLSGRRVPVAGVMREMRRRGIVVLPVHDSFIAPVSNAAALEEVMVDEAAKFGAAVLCKCSSTVPTG